MTSGQVVGVNVEIDISDVLRELEKMRKTVDSMNKKRILKHAAQPVVRRAQELAPKAERVVYKYDTSKLTKTLRAPKGAGVIVAKYLPGHLSRSIQVLEHGRFKKLEHVVYVGPRIVKKGGRGTFGNKRFDAWYAHMVEFGTRFMKAQPFMRPAWESTKGQVLKRIEAGLRQVLNR